MPSIESRRRETGGESPLIHAGDDEGQDSPGKDLGVSILR